MAAPSAYEQPTLNRAWEAFLAHVPTFIVVWVAFGVLYGLASAFQIVIPMIGAGISSDGSGILLMQVLAYLASTPFVILCNLVGVLITAVPAPVYVNRVFATDQSIIDALGASFQSVYRSPHGMGFVGVQILASIVGFVLIFCTCGLGALVVAPMLAFYIQNAAYNKGVIR